MIEPNTAKKIGIVRIVGKIAMISCYNREGQIPSSGFQLPYTFVDDNITAICRYYNGSSNVYGELRVMKNGKVYVYQNNATVNATYVTGEVVAVMT